MKGVIVLNPFGRKENSSARIDSGLLPIQIVEGDLNREMEAHTPTFSLKSLQGDGEPIYTWLETIGGMLLAEFLSEQRLYFSRRTQKKENPPRHISEGNMDAELRIV